MKSTKAINLKLEPLNIALDVFSTIDTGVVVYPDEEPRQNKIFYWNKNVLILPESKDIVVDGPLYPFILETLNKYIIYLDALEGFVNTYSTAEDMKKLIVYWQICNDAKL